MRNQTEKEKQYSKQYREKNRDILIEKSRKWRKENPEKSKQCIKNWMEKNIEKYKKTQKEYREKHREKLNQNLKIYHQNDERNNLKIVCRGCHAKIHIKDLSYVQGRLISPITLLCVTAK